MPHNRRKRDKVVIAFTRLVIVMFAAILMIFAYTIWQSYEGRVGIRNATVAGCERSKLDRAANAAGWTAHATYINHVTSAASVQEDVKSAARVAVRTYIRISRELRERAHIDCSSAFPKTSLFPRRK